MEYSHLLIRAGELFLKGKNQHLFEKQLINNLKKVLPKEVVGLKRLRGRLVIIYFNDHEAIKGVFGIVSYSPAMKVKKNIDEIKKVALELIKTRKGTFKVETKRSDKTFPTKSPELNVLIGKYVEENSNLEFSFKDAKTILKIEINQDGVFIFDDVISCFGGLPVGIEGTVSVLIDDEASILAGLLMMKRGCNIIPVGFKEKDISLLDKFSPKELKLDIIEDFSNVKEDILVTGETLDGFEKRDSLVVLKPLISYSKQQIKGELKMYN